MFAGASVTCDTDDNADGTIVLSDGIGGSVDIAVLGADSIVQMYDKIVTAVNADTDIAYNAVLAEDNSFVQLYHKYTLDVNKRLSPSIVSGGTGTWSIADTGTYEIPVGYHYIDDVARLSIGYLMDSIPQIQEDE
jgi:phage tail sheath gpL-like